MAKFNDKKFFLKVCKKLKDINILNEELLLINNIQGKSCFEYILQEIKEKKNKIIKNDFEIYQQFLNYFPGLINSLSLEERKLFVTFSCLITFEDQNWNEIDFNDAINSIYNLKEKNSDILNIFEFLYYPNESGLNYLNFLYYICKREQDFEKLFQLIKDITKISKNNKLCISEHISYVLRKMNSTKVKGEKEMEYGMKLINEIIPLLIQHEPDEIIINIISVRKKLCKRRLMNFNMKFNNSKGICNSLVSNPNISFDKKIEILSFLKNILGKYFEEIVDEDFLCLYKLFDAYNKKEINESNINNKFKENIFVQKIFSDFYYIGDLYREVYKTWKQFQKLSINEYISSLNQYINNNSLGIFGKYKIRYNLSEEKIYIIARLIIAYGKQNFSNETEKEYLLKNFKNICHRHGDNFELLYKKFMQSNPKLTNILLKMINKKTFITKIEFLEIFFSFNYDYEIIFNDEVMIKDIKETFFKGNKLKDIYLEGPYNFLKIFKNSIISSRNKPHESSYYKFILKHFPLKQVFINQISLFNIIIKKYLNSLIYNWEKECDFSELKTFINENPLIFCFLFSTKGDNEENAKNKIFFFFDEFINALEPNSKEKYSLYRNLALEYLEYNKVKKNFFNLDSKYYLSLWLIFIRLKFGKYNPQILILFFSYYKGIYQIFLYFLKSFFNTEKKQDILYHYLFSENDLTPKEDNLLKLPDLNYQGFNVPDILCKYLSLFFSKYLYQLNKIENSFVFYYISKILEKLLGQQESDSELEVESGEENSEEKKEKEIIEINIGRLLVKKPELYKSFILEINEKQDEKIYNLTKELFFNNIEINIPLYSFLEVEPGEFNEEKILHQINILKQLSKDLDAKTKSINEEDIKGYLYKEKSNDNTLMNLYRFLFVLKNKNESLLNCVKNNKFIVLYSFIILLRNYYFCIVKQYKQSVIEKKKEEKNNLPSIEEKYNCILEEIYNFANFFNNNENNFYEKNDEFSISKSLLYISSDENYKFLIKKLEHNIRKIRSQIFYNRNENNLIELFSILNKDIFTFCSYIFLLYYESFINNKSDYKCAEIDEISNKISFTFNHFLYSINPELTKKYSPFEALYHNLLSIELNKNKNNESLLEAFFEEISRYEVLSCHTSFITVYIYLKKIYPKKNSIILLYLSSKDDQNFFTTLKNCITETKNESNKEKHFFIEEENYCDKNCFKGNNKFDDINIRKQIEKFIINYLIDLNYLENSFVYRHIDMDLKEENIEKKIPFLTNVIFNYNPPEEKNDNNTYKILHNKLFNLFSNNFTFYGFLNEDYLLNINNRERMMKKIKIIETLIKYSLNPNYNINLIKEEYCGNYMKKENFMNLYSFLSELKSENKRLVNFAKNNSFFLKETIKLLVNINTLMKNRLSVAYLQDNEIKMKSEFVLNEIKEFFNDLFHDENNRIYLLQCEINNYKKINNLLIEFALFYNNNFAHSNKNYEEYKKMILFIFESIKGNQEIIDRKKIPYKDIVIKNLKITDFGKALTKLFQNDIDKFCDFLSIILQYFNKSTKVQITKLIISIMKTNIKRFFDNFSKIKSTISNIKSFEIEKEMDTVQTIEFILNNSDYDIYSKLDIINNSSIYQNAQKAFILLSRINNKKASLFVYKKLEDIIDKNTNTERFIDFINNTINNNLVFDYLLSWLSEREMEEIFKDNKEYQKVVISSLFRYSTINGYYIIKELLKHLSKYMPQKTFQSIIYTPTMDPTFSPLDYNLEDIFIKDENTYLLTYSLSNKVAQYETIAVILSFCQFPQGIMKLFEHFQIGLDLNFSNISCCNFFSGIKDKEKIKELEINFYNLIILYESITSNYNILEKYSDIEKFIFNNIIKIFILDLTPRELMVLTDENIPEARFRDIKNDEIKLFVLLALFEIKGLPILPIKKYYPSFFSKIETFFNNFKSFIKITPICLKQNSDVKLYEKLKKLIQDKSCKYIIENFPLFNNLFTIFLLEGKNSLPINAYNEKITSIYPLIIDLINNSDLVPFYDNNTNSEFFESIYLINEKQKIEVNSYRILINSLLNFHQSSYIIIQNNEEKRNKYKWKNKNEKLNVYSSYLEAISNISRYVIFISDENKNLYNVNFFLENLSQENEKRINALKTSINLDKIVLYILHQIEYENENNNDEFMICVKTWINNYLKNNVILNNLSKEKIINIVSYFKYLNLACSTLLKFINQFNELDKIRDCINEINLQEPINLKIKCCHNKNKEQAEKETKQSFDTLGTNILFNIKNALNLNQKEQFNLKKEISSNISIYFYFNEEKEEFVESYTDMNLDYFIKKKYDLIYSFIDDINDINDIIFINENIGKEKMDAIFSEICFTMNSKFDESQKDGTFKMFKSFMEESKKYISKYLEDTAFDLYQPNYNYFRFLMIDKIRQILFSYLYPCISFNNALFNFCQNNFFHNYVDFSELISSIKETEFYSDNNLNSAFQLKAINYLICGDSNLYLFLLDLYEKIRKKSLKKRFYEIKECFKIKIEKGNKSHFEQIKKKKENSEISDISSIISNNNLNGKRKKLKLKVADFINTKNKIFFAIVSMNPTKRKKVPLCKSGIHVPSTENYLGATLGYIYKKAFQRNFIIYKKSDFNYVKCENIPLKSENKSKKVKYINIFEYIFTIKSVDNQKIIHINQNDISEILRDYSSKEAFTLLLNRNGYIEKKWKLKFDLDDIEINYKFP